MSKLGTYSELLSKLKDDNTARKGLDEKNLENFKKDLLNINESDWHEVEEVILLCIDCRMSSVIEYATVLLKKKNIINWKDHSNTITKMLNRVLECGKEPLAEDQDASTYRDFMTVLVPLLRSLKTFEQNTDILLDMVRAALATGRNSLQNVIASFSEHLPWDKHTEWAVEVMDITYGILQTHPQLDKDDILASCVQNLWHNMFNAVYNKPKKAAAYVDSVKKVMVWCKDAEWFDPHDSSKPTLNFKLLQLIIDGFVRTNRDCKELVVPFFDICMELWENEDEVIVDHITTLMTMLEGNIAAELGGYDCTMKLINMFLSGEDPHAICRFGQAYPKCPEPFNERLEEMASYMEWLDDSLVNAALSFFQAVATENVEAFTPLVVDKLVKTLAMEGTFHVAFMALVPLSAKRPELFEPHEDAIIESMYKTDHMMLYGQGGNILAQLVVTNGSEERAKRYMKVFADIIELGPAWVGLCLIINMKSVGSKYPAALAEYKDLFEEKKTEPLLGDHCVIALDMIAGRSLDGVARDIEETQEDLAVLDERVTETNDNVEGMVGTLNINKVLTEALQEATRDQEERLKDVEDVVEEVVDTVEDIDRKTLSHAPVWSKDVSKLLNASSDNDWRLVSQRLGFSNEDITIWSTHGNPCLSMLDTWFSKNKTKEATYAVLNILEDIDRVDAYLIVENTLKQAEGVIADEEAEYTTPPSVFISYQWNIQDEVKLLKKHLEMAGYQVWMDIGQMGGGDKLFEKIDTGIREAKVIICCVTEKYAKSPNCNREVNLAVNLQKPMIPLLMEQVPWPPKGSMGPIFGEMLFIRFFTRQGEHNTPNQFWPSSKFQELLMQIRYNVAPNEDLIHDSYIEWLSFGDSLKPTKTKDSEKTQLMINKDDTSKDVDEKPDIFISYQWGKQPQIKALYNRLSQLGYSCWLDILQMGGGDSLYDKIDKGVRNCRVFLACVTSKYALSANCRREASLAKSVNKPMLTLVLDKTQWPPKGAIQPVFDGVPCIDFSELEKDQVTNICKGSKADELESKLRSLVQVAPEMEEERAIVGNRENQQDTTSESPQASSNHTTSGRRCEGLMEDPLDRKNIPTSKQSQGITKTKSDMKEKDVQKSLSCVIL